MELQDGWEKWKGEREREREGNSSEEVIMMKEQKEWEKKRYDWRREEGM